MPQLAYQGLPTGSPVAKAAIMSDLLWSPQMFTLVWLGVITLVGSSTILLYILREAFWEARNQQHVLAVNTLSGVHMGRPASVNTCLASSLVNHGSHTPITDAFSNVDLSSICYRANARVTK